ncbi:aminotransferase [Woeseia oceani]|uniref:Aminotransferase n=1 Tax=Woeseia oceani TaxID=1548547 RepID=A0A193LCD5_9GAMM|nr:aminotransferase [Woeseia oceani]ANO50096.1 aminotransferase [Woeseia oceani]
MTNRKPLQPATADGANKLHNLDRLHHLHPFTDLQQYANKGGRVVSRAEHIYIFDATDKKIMDGMSGLWCCNLGYSQPTIVAAITEQLQTLPYYNSFFNCSNEAAITLAAELADVMPSGFNRFFFTNSGSEANDTNIRLVHRYFDILEKPQKRIFISRKNAYHGSTIAASSLGGMSAMHKQITGLTYVEHIEQPYWFENGGSNTPEEYGLIAARALEAKIDELGEENVAAFIAEPIQGAGGVIVPPTSYWPEIQRICDERDILLISDEVICGFGRTGNWFGCETYGMKPDLITFAKGVSNGFQPLGGVAVSDKVANVITTSDGEFAHGFTYSGHPAACAAGIATIALLRDSGILEHTRQHLGPYFRQRCQELSEHAIVGEVRTQGMLAAFELVKNKDSKERLGPDGSGAQFARDCAIESGLMVRAVGDSIISAPPFVCSNDEINILIDRLVAALDAASDEFGVRG